MSVTLTDEQYAALRRDADLGRLLREWQARAWDAETSQAISGLVDWTRIAAAPSFAELQRRRAVVGPLARTIDPDAARLWAATGHSTPQEVPA